MTDVHTPERQRLDAWSAQNPRDELALVMLAAWVNATPETLPVAMKTHTCAATMEAWARVGEAAVAWARHNPPQEVAVLVEALQASVEYMAFGATDNSQPYPLAKASAALQGEQQ